MSESFSYGGQPRPRHDSAPLVMLPAPLAVNTRQGAFSAASPSLSGYSRNSEEAPMLGDAGSRAQLIPSPSAENYNSAYSSPDPYSSNQIESYVNRAGQGAGGSMGGAVLRQSMVSTMYPGETQNPYRTTPAQAIGYDDDYPTTTTTTTESDDTQTSGPYARQQSPQQYQRARTTSRGVALSDNGPVPGPEGGVRRVARQQARRPSSQQPTNRYSRTSMYANPTNGSSQGHQLPPGAAPPRPQGGSDY